MKFILTKSDDANIEAEKEKVCNKARTFINKYIKRQKDAGYEKDEIDIMQFTNDLYFITDFIDEKDNKLNGMFFAKCWRYPYYKKSLTYLYKGRIRF